MPSNYLQLFIRTEFSEKNSLKTQKWSSKMGFKINKQWVMVIEQGLLPFLSKKMVGGIAPLRPRCQRPCTAALDPEDDVWSSN